MANKYEVHARVLRGGAFNYPASLVRSSFRSYNVPTNRNILNGVRIVRTKRKEVVTGAYCIRQP